MHSIDEEGGSLPYSNAAWRKFTLPIANLSVFQSISHCVVLSVKSDACAVPEKPLNALS